MGRFWPGKGKNFLHKGKISGIIYVARKMGRMGPEREGSSVYQMGDLILYGSTGVCRVTEIVAKKLSRTEPERMYYILTPLYQSGTITTPVDNNKIFTRPVISRQEALDLIDSIPGIEAAAYHNQNLQQLENHYKQAIGSHDCRDLLRVTMSTYRKKKEREEAKLKFGAVDKRYMERAEALLFGELAVALDIARDEVELFIRERLAISEI